MMVTLTMYDTVDVSTVPLAPQAVAGYTSGHWPTYDALVAKFPNAHHLSVAVNSSEKARCLDVESGDATNSQAPSWFRNLADRSRGKPVLYTSASNVQALVNTMTAAGIARNEYFVWSAHYTYREHICSPGVCGYPVADATQWNDHALNRNLDQSLVNDYFFGTPKPVDPYHYDWFDDTPRTVLLKKRREREQVKLYDKLRAEQTDTKHPHRLQINFVRVVLKSFAGRVSNVAHRELVNGKPSWDAFHRGWRYQELIKRSRGERVV